ncbi:MAG: lipopolysaccharide kinase InaA family protein [Myxococcota bacterium]
MRGLGLLERGGLERWIADAPSAGTGRTHTALVTLGDDGPRVVVRQLHHGGLLGSVLGARYARPARVIRELEVTAGLRAAGAPVPDPVLALARRRGVGFALAIATVHEADTVDALTFLEGAATPGQLERAAAAAGTAVHRFHDAGGLHADLHVKDLLIREAGADTEAIVIDLDRARRAAPPAPRRRAAELGRLWRSLWKRGVAERVGHRGAAAFLAAYCAGDHELREALAARLPAERRKARLHALRYR